mmetsp:Transcript_12216/g.42375  ORF Transcript_12216/g.42375 Transcript_12216/m.42375 type:complete len:254 (+) Transcript_12216:2773-3534(+)
MLRGRVQPHWRADHIQGTGQLRVHQDWPEELRGQLFRASARRAGSQRGPHGSDDRAASGRSAPRREPPRLRMVRQSSHLPPKTPALARKGGGYVRALARRRHQAPLLRPHQGVLADYVVVRHVRDVVHGQPCSVVPGWPQPRLAHLHYDGCRSGDFPRFCTCRGRRWIRLHRWPPGTLRVPVLAFVQLPVAQLLHYVGADRLPHLCGLPRGHQVARVVDELVHRVQDWEERVHLRLLYFQGVRRRHHRRQREH